MVAFLGAPHLRPSWRTASAPGRIGRRGRRRQPLARAQEAPLLALDAQRLGVQHLELDAAVLGLAECRGIGGDRRAGPVALRGPAQREHERVLSLERYWRFEQRRSREERRARVVRKSDAGYFAV